MILVTTTNNHITNKKKDLSILVSMYGLSFMIYDQVNHEKKFFEYTFEALNPIIIEQKLKTIIQERTVLQTPFSQINIIHHNMLNTLVPDAFFDPKKTALLLSQQVKVLPNDQIVHNQIPALKLYNLYIPYKNIDANFNLSGQKINHKHSASNFLWAITEERKKPKNLPVYEVFLNIFPEDFQIAVFKNEKLNLYNAFTYQNIDEFLYYLFFIIESLEIQETVAQFYFMGIDMSHEIISNLKEFTNNISVLKAKSPSQINNFF